ncbi:MAG: hypothetical protein ACQEWU_10915 [Bacillota bacterium]|uniref:Uncharacterized protein n=2 Tax=Virgibacillus TaxID=84406 RepID=A0A941DVR3_9BACI|nr:MULTISPECIES: hypothetical protein [Bacillaceae]NAZ08716.1 hypothetical protein [Agaribacter marinus]MBR7796004.1 hypothetical protein [Virgibacillus salarius]MCC2249939.1 hypothetical protein [Virgibacillus sp. AGTR]MDY7044149.1 hypothetical protein [Virgibacillus sp. M23]WBX82128.1 hypothetical protein PD280_11200 [Virgibacillus salarius]
MRNRAIGICFIMFLMLFVQLTEVNAAPDVIDKHTEHNWQEYHTETSFIKTGTHEYKYWKNFMRHKRTCEIYQKLKTIVYYCDVHDHAKSETIHEGTVHSEKHD